MFNKSFISVTVAIVGLSLAGCAEPAREEAMLPKQIAPASQGNPYRNSIASVSGFGGEETNPMWTSEISKDDFQRALQRSLEMAGFYSASGKLSLRADILTVEQPAFGIDLTVSMTVRYNLFDSSGRLVFDRTLHSTYKAEFSEAFVGIERLRKANEGAARENIAQFIESLGGSANGSEIGAVS